MWHGMCAPCHLWWHQLPQGGWWEYYGSFRKVNEGRETQALRLNFRITPIRLLIILLLKVWGCVWNVSTRPDTSYCIINGKNLTYFSRKDIGRKFSSVCLQHETYLTATVAVGLVVNLCALHRARCTPATCDTITQVTDTATEWAMYQSFQFLIFATCTS